jgi:hypothetical protein
MFKKTLVLPTDDAALAAKMFHEIVHDEPYVLLVVLGDSDVAQQTVTRADKLAGAPDDWRWVVWARVPAHIAAEVQAMRDKGIKPDMQKPDIAFSTSLGDTIVDVIAASEPKPDNVRIFLAFAHGEAEGDDSE